MSNTLAAMLAVFLVCGCTAIPPKEERLLVPPAGSTRETRIRDVNECVAKAREAYANGEPVDDVDRARLQGRSTVKFFREGRPCVNEQGIPGMWTSALVPPRGYAPKGISDRYIIYLMARGYQWPSVQEPIRPATQPTR